VLPNIVLDREFNKLNKRLEAITENIGTDIFGLVISASGQLELARRLGIKRLRMNYTMGLFNSVAAGHYAGEGAEAIGLSPELTLSQIRDIAGKLNVPAEAVVYGYLPVMTTEYCPVSMGAYGCDQMGGCKNHNYGIIDEKRKVFRIIRLDSCRTQILNADVLFLAEELSDITGSGVSILRGDFYFESPDEIGRIIKLYRNHNNMDKDDSAIAEKIKGKGFTKGHFYRGVD
jgi:putative protease